MSVFGARMRTRAVEIRSRERRCIIVAAMQSRTVAHSLHTDTDDGRQHPSVVSPERRRPGRERERARGGSSSELRGVSPRGVFGFELHPAFLPDETRRSATHTFTWMIIFAYDLSCAALRTYVPKWNASLSAIRNLGSTRIEDDRREWIAHPGDRRYLRQQLHQQRGSISVELGKIVVPGDKRPGGELHDLGDSDDACEISRDSASLVNGEHFQRQKPCRAFFFYRGTVHGRLLATWPPRKLISIRRHRRCKFGRWNSVWRNHPSSTLKARLPVTIVLATRMHQNWHFTIPVELRYVNLLKIQNHEYKES